jgi:hypothetical protein
MSESASITGRWRITEMDNWDQEAIDLVKPGFIEFGEDGLGSLGFIVVTGELDCRDADRLTTPRLARPAPPSVPSEPARMPRKN